MSIGMTLEPGDNVQVRLESGETVERFFEDGPWTDKDGVFIVVANGNGEVEGCLWNEQESCWDAEK